MMLKMMKTTAVHAALLLTLLASAAGAQQQESARIPAPDTRFDDATIRPLGVPDIDAVGMAWEPETHTARSMADALEDALDPETLGLAGTVYASAGDLVIDAPAATIHALRRHIAAIEHFVEGRAVLRVTALHARDANDARSAADVRAAATEGRADVIWSGRVSARRGEPFVVGETETLTFVCDHDVEVAQGASIADPILATLETGVRIALQQRALDATHALVNVSFQYSEVAEMSTIEIGAGTIEQPRVPFAVATTSMVVATDAPQLLTMSHPSQPGVLALVIEVASLPDVPALPHRLVDLAAHTASGLWLQHVPVGIDTGERWDGDDGDESSGPYGDAADLLYALEDREQALGLTPTLAMVFGGAELPPAAKTEQLTRRTWRLSRDEVRALPGFDPIDDTVAFEAAVELEKSAPDVEVRIPTVRGGAVQTAVGELTRIIADYDVEIASTAAITDPIVMSFVEGHRVERQAVPFGAAANAPISWAVVRVLERSTRPVVVRKDINGKRLEEQIDRIDVVRHRSVSGHTIPTPRARLEARRVGDAYFEIDVWKID